ncbi:MAG: 5-formyltetrahydrofolate cyclo-ligase [Clostridiales bacterium]|nr:5-formyltetrahydrofolate cyclo-ligase [Clostridiales bacterium]
METKQLIRKEIYKRRKAASAETVAADSHEICKALTGLEEFSGAEWIYLYIDCKNEVMTGEIMERALQMGKRVAAPKVIGKDMVFYEIFSREDLEPGYFGIPEPREGLKEAVGEEGLLLMPGVAFDREKHRVGYGGGFYDRYLEKHTGHFKAAVAFEFQMMDQVPTEPTDILPDLVITEKQIYR